MTSRPCAKCLDEAKAAIDAAGFIDSELREEALQFIDWLRTDHMTFLGYEYLRVDGDSVEVDARRSLGVLRHRDTRGAADLRRIWMRWANPSCCAAS
jgi:glutamate dehydrogenase